MSVYTEGKHYNFMKKKEVVQRHQAMQTTLAVVEDELDSAEESVQDIQGTLQEQLDLLHVVVQANAITLKTLMQQITQLKRYAHTH